MDRDTEQAISTDIAELPTGNFPVGEKKSLENSKIQFGPPSNTPEELWDDSDDEGENLLEEETTESGPVPEELLATNPDVGLSEEDVRVRQKKYGKNQLKEEKRNLFKKFFLYFWGPIQWLVELAVVLSIGLQDWIDVGVIIGLLLLNAIVGFVQEFSAESTIDALKNTLALKATVTRSGQILEIAGTDIVPGDIIHITEGDIIPADARLLGEGAFLQVDQSSLTGESLAVRKGKNDPLYSSSAVKRGTAVAVVTAIGDHTFVGRAAALVAGTENVGHVTEIMNKMGGYLIAADFLAVFIIFIASYYRGTSITQILIFAASVTIVAVPIALPTVITTTLAVGAQLLGEKKAIVSRLAAIESLAGVDVLCSDKTGTLTQNKLSVHDPFIMRGASTDELFLVATLSSHRNRKGIDAIDKSIVKTVHRQYKHLLTVLNEYRVLEFQPFDPVTKRILVKLEKGGEVYVAAKGAPQAIVQLAEEDGEISQELLDDYNSAVEDLASRGFRSIGVAFKKPGQKWRLLGIISLFDPPRFDTKRTIDQAKELGLSVKMLTGDQLAIGKETARQLGMGTKIYNATKLGLGKDGAVVDGEEPAAVGSALNDFVEAADGFAQVFPEHKYQVVEILQNRGHRVAMTGDGVNDAPSLKKADVGIAVEGASDAARTASAIVFLAPGLGTIIEAIKTSRQIFHRMRSYAQYRIALSLHLVFYLTLSVIILNLAPNLTLVVFLAIFSDIAVLMIAYDRAPFDKAPVDWNIPNLMGTAVILGTVLAGGTWIIHTITFTDPTLADKWEPIVFLEIALTQNWLIFSTRTNGHFWSYLPSWQLTLAVFVVDIVASIMVAFPTFTTTLTIIEIVRIWLYAVGVFVVCDTVQIAVGQSRNFDFIVNGGAGKGLFKKHDAKKSARRQEDQVYLLQRVATMHEGDEKDFVPLGKFVRQERERRRSVAARVSDAKMPNAEGEDSE